jgi:uncharacterized protein YndB with AHSA1/START domain
MNTIKQTYLIDASPAEVWRALTEPEIIELWSDADAEFEPRQGAEYALWDGSIVGEVVAVVPRKKLAMTWQPDHWIVQDSLVTFTLTPVGKQTRIDLLHEHVEAFDYEGTREGWDAYYLGAIKRMFEKKIAKSRNTKPAKKAKAAKGKDAARKKSAKTKKATRKKRIIQTA